MGRERSAITTADKENVVALEGQQYFCGKRNHPDLDAIEEYDAQSGDEVVTSQHQHKHEQKGGDGHNNKLSAGEGEGDLSAVKATSRTIEAHQDGVNETYEEHPVRPDLAVAKEREDNHTAIDTDESADDDMGKGLNLADATEGYQNGKESRHQHQEEKGASRAEAEIEESPSPLAAEAKGERRSNHRRKAEENRGGRRYSKAGALSSLRRLLGIEKYRHDDGDLVEAEWDGSRWLFVGDDAAVENGKDGSEHRWRRDGCPGTVLRQLGPPGHTKGSAGTLARHVPVLDLGPGRLHRNLEPKNLPGDDDEYGDDDTDKKEKRRRRKNMKTRSPQKKQSSKNSNNNSSSFRETSSSHAALEQSMSPNAGRKDLAVLRGRGSVGDISQRRKRGQNAVWGGRTSRFPGRSPSEIAAAEMSESMSASLRENFRWWDTGTQYAFQPNLPPRLTITPSRWSVLSDHVRKRGIPRTVAGGKVGGCSPGHVTPVSTDGGSDRDRELGEAKRDHGFMETAAILVVQPAEGNPDRGERVYFVL